MGLWVYVGHGGFREGWGGPHTVHGPARGQTRDCMYIKTDGGKNRANFQPVV